MTFVQILNEYTVLTATLMVVVFFIGLRLGYVRGGWNRHLPYLWTLIIYSIYVLITPLFFYFDQNYVIIGTDIRDYYGIGFAFNIVGVLCFILGYWIANMNKTDLWLAPPVYDVKDPHKIISILFYSLYGIVLFNLAIGGANIQQVFIGNEIVGLGASGGSYFLQNFTDSLICVIVLAYLYGIPGRILLFWIAISLFLFSILGFRYRIVLSLFGILFVYLYKNEVSVQRIAVGGILALLFFYGIMFSTVNRKTLIMKTYNELEFDPLSYDYGKFFDQTRGALPDMAVYKLYDNPNRNPQHDYGLTMFGYVFIRMIPRAIYPDKDRFYPPPQLATTLQAYDAWWARFSGEATLSVAALYIAFGWAGIVFGHFFWGVFLRKFANNIRRQDKLQVASYFVVALATFQWITRGYFPQVIDHFVYMMIPIWIIRFLSRNSRHREVN
ncbi:O-antigen polysaccharide polymerase Wzy [Flavitalea antarctica]